MAKWAALSYLVALAVLVVPGCAAASGADRKSIGTEEQAVRAIEDRSLRECWMLLRNSRQPGAPGWFVAKRGMGCEAQTPGKTTADLRLPTVVHGGDRIIVEQNTPKIHAEFDAVALMPAASGEVFEARLKANGHIVRAVAQAPGQATLAGLPQERP